MKRNNIALAKLNRIHISSRKLNLVANQIRGLEVKKALDVLTHSRKRISTEVKKTLISAISNAENNHGLDIDALVVHEVNVGRSFLMKRFMARAKGRGVNIKKPFSTLTILVCDQGV